MISRCIKVYESSNHPVHFFDNNFSDDEFDLTKSFISVEDEQSIDLENMNQIMNPYYPEVIQEEDSNANDERYFNQNDIKKKNNFSNNEEKIELDKKVEGDKKQNQKETRETTVKALSVKKKAKLFESKKKKYRNDYLIKKFKVNCFSKFATDKLKTLLKSCQFQGDLKSAKVYLPDNKMFTQDSNLKRNKEFLPMKLKDIYILEDDNKFNKGRNAKLFDKIFRYEGEKNNDAYDGLIHFLNQTVEETIIEYYDSEENQKFNSIEEIIENDMAFYKEKGFHFIEKYGFLKLIKNNY